MKITKNKYLAGFAIIVFFLALIRLVFPSVAENRTTENRNRAIQKDTTLQAPIHHVSETTDTPSKFFASDGTPAKHRILSVSSYQEAFPDSQQVQIQSAMKWGVSIVANREEAEERKQELVYVAASPYYHVDKMHRSIPYLVPQAAALLNDLGRAYYDSLQLKGIPLHQFIVTSVTRTREDVEKLRRYNGNATENSCHLYGTTFDICYNRYHTVQPPGEHRRQVRDDSLKFVLCEVLRDMRQRGCCHVKYEVKQGCFHITVR